MTRRVYAIVKEKDEQQYVTTLSDQELEDEGDLGIEQIVLAWCLKKKLTFVDYTI